MPYDANAILVALVTGTATVESTAYDLVVGTPRRGLKVRCIVSSHRSLGTAGNIFRPKIQHSDDNTTWYDHVIGEPYTGATAATVPTVPQFLNIETSKRYIRGVMEQTTTSGTPTIAYLMDIGIARP